MENAVAEVIKANGCDSQDSCCDQRVVNSGEPHVSFHDGSLHTVPNYKGDYLNSELAVPIRTAFQGSYASPSPTPKMMSSVAQAYPSTYTIGGQNVSYFSATPSVVPSFASHSAYITGAAYSAPTVSRATYTGSYTAPQTYTAGQSTSYTAPQTYTAGQATTYTAPQTYTAGQSTTYTAPQTYTTQTVPQTYTTQTVPQTYTSQTSYTMPQGYSTLPSSAQSCHLPYQVPTVIEEAGNTSYPFNYPTVADYPANIHSYNPNAAPFTQEELASFYQNYLKGQEPIYEAPSKCHSVKNEPTATGSVPPVKPPCKKLPSAKFPMRKKKGCCGC